MLKCIIEYFFSTVSWSLWWQSSLIRFITLKHQILIAKKPLDSVCKSLKLWQQNSSRTNFEHELSMRNVNLVHVFFFYTRNQSNVNINYRVRYIRTKNSAIFSFVPPQKANSSLRLDLGWIVSIIFRHKYTENSQIFEPHNVVIMQTNKFFFAVFLFQCVFSHVHCLYVHSRFCDQVVTLL